MPSDPFYSSKEWIKLRSKVKTKWLRDGKRCAYCHEEMTKEQRLIADHAHPRRQYPQLALAEANIVMMHHECHTKKTKHIDYNNKKAIGIDGLPADGSWGMA